jgi:putative tryptophan/tyrosine transport system substrate-binding protein
MPDRLSNLAGELVRLKVEVIVAMTPSAAFAAKNATVATPIVFTLVSEPVGSGLVASLVRPGGNITGLSSVHGSLTAKRLELLKEAVPSLKSILLLANPVNPGSPEFVRDTRTAAGTLGLELRLVEARHPTDLEPTLTAIAREPRAVAVLLLRDELFWANRVQIAELTRQAGVPLVGWQREWVERGALFSYGADDVDMIRRTEARVARILRGAKPADLPVEQPTRFELAINMKTTKALGLTIPPSTLARADYIIQ